MEAGDAVEVTRGKETFNVIIDDRVLPDRSAGQYEAGWWVYDERAAKPALLFPGAVEVSDRDTYFLSEAGVLYDWIEDEGWVNSCGEAPLLVKLAAERDRDEP